MNRQPHRDARRGFTLVELLVAMTAATILAMTMGLMLWQSTQWYARCHQGVNLQRDLRVTLDTLARMARSATNMSFSTGLVFTAEFDGRSPASIYPAGGSLWFDPNTSVGGDQVALAPGTLETFNVAVAAQGITAAVGLRNSYETVTNRIVISRRN